MKKTKDSPRDSVPSVVREELDLLEQVREALKRHRTLRRPHDFEKELTVLRDRFAEERLEDDRASIMEEMDRISALSALRAQYDPDGIDPDNPYFAHLRYTDDEGREKDIVLGKQTFIKGKVRVVDWRNAPISRVYYNNREGDDFDEVFAGRQVDGTVTARRSITIGEGRLLRVGCPEAGYYRTGNGWERIRNEAVSLHGGQGAAGRPDTMKPFLGSSGAPRELRGDKHLSEIAGLLDERQFKLITRPGQGLVVVQGSAGSGKTTVGLHRIAYLNYSDPDRFGPKGMLVIVFSEALANYTSRVLPALGVENVQVRTLEKWASMVRRKHFPELTKAYSDHPPAEVVRFKSHRILIPMLQDAARSQPKARPEVLFDELFTDSQWMRDGVDRYAPKAFSDGEIARIVSWCADQHFARVEDSGPIIEELNVYDREDDPILLYLHQLLRGPLRKSGRRSLLYNHLMIDEAQDFSPLELLVLMQTVRDNSITIAGDSVQRISDFEEEGDWTDVFRMVEGGGVEIEPLEVSYRSTYEIIRFSHHVLGKLAPPDPPKSPRKGDPVLLFRSAGIGEALTFLAEALIDLMERESNAGVAILTRFFHQAEEVYKALRHTGLRSATLVREQNFSFGPGVEICDIAQTKGLEFDYVILMNVDRETFPDHPQSRRILHIGATRAIHQLWLFSWMPLSPLVPEWLPPRMVG